MEALFESALLFSLAVLIILIGLLVYYFKGRVVDLEQKNAKCLEIINDIYGSHCLLKQTVTAMLMEAADEASAVDAHASASESVYAVNTSSFNTGGANGFINVEIEDEPDIDDSSRVSYTDDEDNDDEEEQMKTIVVDFNAPETYELDTLDVDEIDMNDGEESSDDTEEPVVLNIQEPEIQVVKTETDETALISSVAPVASNDYKKMSAVALRGYIISSGIQTDAAKLRRMTKQELIDIVSNSTKEQ
jgi:hypothetical protein